MEGGGGSNNNNTSTSRVCPNNNSMMMGFGGGDNDIINNGLSSMVMMMNSSSSSSGNKVFLPPTTLMNNNNNYNMRAKIMSHPHFPRLLGAYINCQKVGAPPEVVVRLEEAAAYGEEMNRSTVGGSGSGSSSGVVVGEDPALDQFMEAYCEMLTKYEQELTKPFKEAMLFLSKIECQLKALTVNVASNSEEDVDHEVMNENYNIDPQAEDMELKGQLLRKYSGYLGSLKQEFLKKKKKGKLPKEARQQLLDWWNRHYKWPYPSESQKLALAESTGLDQKQINNWFINQRKRHWKPSEDMQFVMMDASNYPHGHYYMENIMAANHPFPMDCTPTRF